MAGTGANTRTFNADPASFNPATSTAAPGVFVQDFSGAVQGLSYVALVGGVPTLLPIPGTGPAAVDVIAPGTTSSGSGNLTLTFTLTLNGAAAASRGVSAILESGAPVEIGLTAGSGISMDTVSTLIMLGRASAGGLLRFTLDGTPGDAVSYVIQTNGPTGATLAGSVVLPA